MFDITAERYTKTTEIVHIEVESDDPELHVFNLVCELAERYIKLKKQGDYTNWVPGEIVLDEFTSDECNAVTEMLSKLKLLRKGKNYDND